MKIKVLAIVALVCCGQAINAKLPATLVIMNNGEEKFNVEITFADNQTVKTQTFNHKRTINFNSAIKSIKVNWTDYTGQAGSKEIDQAALEKFNTAIVNGFLAAFGVSIDIEKDQPLEFALYGVGYGGGTIAQGKL